MRQIALLFGVAIAVIAIIVGVRVLPSYLSSPKEEVSKIDTEEEAKDFETAQELLAGSEPEEALKIIYKYRTQIEDMTPMGLKWMELFIQASVDTRDIQQLVVLFNFFPEIFKEHENASLLVADAYIVSNNPKDYNKVRSLWTDRETKLAAWFVLDVDMLLLEGRRHEAIEKLKSRTFKDKADIGRLVRLALIYSNEDPKKSWTYLAEAYSKDPQNLDVRSYRAKLLESVGKNSLAHKEYMSAVRISPSNVFLKDQLANFYLRQKQYLMALDVLKHNLNAPSVDNIWVKTLFWNKVTTPIEFDWKNTPMPEGKLDPLIQYMINLNQNTFWDHKTFEHVTNNKYFLKTQQETFWLRLLQAFKDNDLKEAHKLLRYNPFTTVSWYPELEVALKRVLNYREKGSLKIDSSQLPPDDLVSRLPDEAVPEFFKQLNAFAKDPASDQTKKEIPADIKALLDSKEAISAVFLTAGWYEAGLELHVLPIIPNDFPNWVAFSITQGLFHNRSSLEALEFATVQRPTPELGLLTAELMIAGGDSDSALKKLNNLTKYDNEIGYRSAWLASLLYIEKKDYDHARTAVQSQPRLVQDILGQETLARIAHLKGDTKLADRLYSSLEKKSPEARSYLARKAFRDHDWKRARELTEQLIIDYPDNDMLRKNLEKIIENEEQSSQ